MACLVSVSQIRKALSKGNQRPPNSVRYTLAFISQYPGSSFNTTISQEKHCDPKGDSRKCTRPPRRPASKSSYCSTSHSLQVTYVSSASAIHRITGLLLSGSLYGLATLYLCAPALDLNLDSAAMAAAFGSLPVAVKAALKFGLSMPFTYHWFNGVKHLIWDSGRLLSKTRSGRLTWVVLACSMSASFGHAEMHSCYMRTRF